MAPPSYLQAAFTLIELLVVIAIIAIIAGLLLPAINLVRASAQQAVCLNNLRQCMMAELSYANDNEGICPPAELATGSPTPPFPANCRNWYMSLTYNQYLDGGFVLSYSTNNGCQWGATLRWPNVVSCPSFKPPNPASNSQTFGQVCNIVPAMTAPMGFIAFSALPTSAPWLADSVSGSNRTLSSPYWWSQGQTVAQAWLIHRKKAGVAFPDGHAAMQSRSDLINGAVKDASIAEP